MVWGIEDWAAMRAAIGVVEALRGFRKKHAELAVSVSVENQTAFLSVANSGPPAEVTVEYTKADNIHGWPNKTLWARWDHDKDAKSVQIPRGTTRRVRVATFMKTPLAMWVCYWGSDHAMAQTTFAVAAGSVWVVDIHAQITSDPETAGRKPKRGEIRLKSDGTAVYRITP
jgi:hypothetical protein